MISQPIRRGAICRRFVLVAACAFGAGEQASAQVFVPARLTALEGRLECPSNVRESAVLFCQVVVGETGEVSDDASTHCFGQTGGDDRRRADRFLQRNVLASRFEPASIDGEPVKVYLSFRAFFVETGGVCDVTVYPNLGNQQAEFGMDYFGPQEIFTAGGWMPEARPIRYESAARNFTGMAFAMSVAVDGLGRASDGRIESNSVALEESLQRSVAALERQRFIPAVVDGVVRPSRYFEFVYFSERARPRLR